MRGDGDRIHELLLLLRSNSSCEYTTEELETPRRRLIKKGITAFRITSSIYGDIWIALTEDAAQGLSDLNGITVYEARHLISLTTAKSEHFMVYGRSAAAAGLWRLRVMKRTT